MFEADGSYIKRSFINRGVQRGFAPLQGVEGYPPNLKFPNPSREGGGMRGLRKCC